MIINRIIKGLLLNSLLLSMIVFSTSPSMGQELEIGMGIGGLKYTGDLARGISIKGITPAGTAFFRTNISKAVSFRISATAGQLVGSDEKTTIDPFAARRGESFDIFLFEASTVFEYHFLKWRDESTLTRWTPYFFGGLAIFGVSGIEDKAAEYSNVQPSLPFGFGFKYILNPKWYLSFEYGARKTFFDYLDNVSGGDGIVKNYQYGNQNDNDMYHFIGLSITYSFYTIPCPVSPYKKNYRSR
ncbi:MAG: DUF6089 family protein [Fulvivirga sp.]|nr:DUF6089 family protein [Fulvivirga sp.]